ncbi:MAG: hypothetical protein HYT72_05205 [Candidatus Aenigmarchaeota archaeon]|nr:hypothetical protein [Candidatus Aenigmarchaeota archaeon]
MATSVADRDALLQEARSYLDTGRVGDAVDHYGKLADAGDWRGYEGLLDVGSNPQLKGWEDYVTFVAGQYEEKFANPRIMRALFPDGFSITETIESMESAFGSYEGCRPLIDAAKGARYNHPYVAFEAVARAAKSVPAEGKDFVYAFGKALGIDKETSDRLLGNSRNSVAQ